VFGVTLEKLLGCVVTLQGSEIDPSKIKAILGMPPLKTNKEMQGFLDGYST